MVYVFRTDDEHLNVVIFLSLCDAMQVVREQLGRFQVRIVVMGTKKNGVVSFFLGLDRAKTGSICFNHVCHENPVI